MLKCDLEIVLELFSRGGESVVGYRPEKTDRPWVKSIDSIY